MIMVIFLNQKRPYVCIQWFNEEVPNFKCLGKGMEALIQAQPGDIITNGGHIGIISAQRKTISASSIENVIVENDWGWREGQRDQVKVFRYMPNSENTLLNRKTKITAHATKSSDAWAVIFALNIE